MMNHIIEVCHTLFFRQTSFYVRFQLAWSKKNLPRNAMWNPDKLSGDHVPLANLLKFPIRHPYVLRSSHIFSQFHFILFRFSMSLDLPFFFSNCPSFYIVRADSPSCSMLYTIVGAGDAAQAAAAAAQERNGAAGIDEGIAADGDATGHVRMLHLQPWRLIGLTNHGQNSPKIRDFGNSMINSKIMSININNHEEHFPVAISLMERSTPGYP